jgi:hypothetical protein
MKIKEFCQEYSTCPVSFYDLACEVDELVEEIINFNVSGIKEEFADVIVFVQMWLWNKLNLNGKLWKLGEKSFDKFIRRRAVWEQIYQYFDIKEKCVICKNYTKLHKIVSHLKKFGINKKHSLQAYRKIVLNGFSVAIFI